MLLWFFILVFFFFLVVLHIMCGLSSRPEIEGIKSGSSPTSVQRKPWVLISGLPVKSLYLFYIVVTKINYIVLEETVIFHLYKYGNKLFSHFNDTFDHLFWNIIFYIRFYAEMATHNS